jgi:hypothetical protein
VPTRAETVTFRHRFTLPGLDSPHPAGTYALRETHRQLDVSWAAHQISLSIMLVDGGTTQALDVLREDLDAALTLDRAAS